MRMLIVMLAVAALAPSAPRFELVQPELFVAAGGQPNAWADVDGDGDLDLFVGFQQGKANRLYRNLLPAARAKQSVRVMVVDEHGRATRAGSEVRVYGAGTRKLLGVGLVDTGSGYCSQNAMPVHVGLGFSGRVDLEVTSMSKTGRMVTRSTGVTPGRGVVMVRGRSGDGDNSVPAPSPFSATGQPCDD